VHPRPRRPEHPRHGAERIRKAARKAPGSHRRRHERSRGRRGRPRRARRVLLLPRHLLCGPERGRLSARDLRSHDERRPRAREGEPANDLHLRIRDRDRQHDARSIDVGPREGRDGERASRVAVQSVVHVPARFHPATSRHRLEDEALQGHLRRDGPALSRLECADAELRDHDGASRTSENPDINALAGGRAVSSTSP
jgi:hypothetical protein